MKPEGPRGEKGQDPNSLEYMEKQIDAERKDGLPLSPYVEEAIVSGEETISFTEFTDLLKTKKPEDIILYSVKTGLLRHLLTDKEDNEIIYTYQGDSYLLNISYDKKTKASHIVETKKIVQQKEIKKSIQKKKGLALPKQQSHTHEEGSYRGYTDPDAEALQDRIKALEQMEKEIAAEGKFVSMPLNENLKEGDRIELFEAAIHNQVNLTEIAFFSIATGILKFTKQIPYGATGATSYYYTNPDYKDVELDIVVKPWNTPQSFVYSIKNNAKIPKITRVGNEELEKIRTDLNHISSTIKKQITEKPPSKPNTIK